MPDAIRVALCDDHAVVRSGLRRILDDEPDITVVGEAGNAEDAVALASAEHPDVFVMDLGLPGTNGIDATALSRDSSDRNSDATLAAFTGTATSAQLAKQQKEDAKKADSGERRLRGVKVLVTTDIASRGIDTTAAKTVILYTVPHTSIDFIHRLGRVGRMGRRGRGIVLVGRGDRRDVVREVREGMFKGMALI